jgi:hypothetical protein
MAAPPAVVPMASSMLAMEMIIFGCDMAREINLYKQKIAEIELQREHMLSQPTRISMRSAIILAHWVKHDLSDWSNVSYNIDWVSVHLTR